MKNKTAEILCVGTELLLGEVVNTNASYIGKKLASLGISVYHTEVVGDNSKRLKNAVVEALSRSDILILSGGLGPTYDDLTKETVAEALGLKMHRDGRILREIEEHFASSGRKMSPNNAKQADIPEGAEALPNRTGTAPGIYIQKDGKTVILLPGPPFELCPMFEESVMPRLKKLSDKILVSRNIHIMGMSESEVEMHLRTLMRDSTNPTLAPYAKEGEVRLRVASLSASEEEGERLCSEMIEKVKASPVGEFIYALDAEIIEKAVVEGLAQKQLTLATAESCTGGYLSKRITDIAGASKVFAGGFITYSNEAKINLLGVSEKTLEKFSAVSTETAIEMAEGARARLHTDIAVSVTGEAGPNPDPATKQAVGTVFVGVSTAHKNFAVELHIPSRRDREYIRKVACSRALKEILLILPHC
ncbi:MAG: competence/damage-inducible protein A [Eubacteriales bacterium]